MPEILPFRGIRYRVPAAELPRVLAPPYDVISPALRDELQARDPRNVVRLVLNRTGDEAGYAEAGVTYRRWLAEGVLAADPEPALYVLEQSFNLQGRSLRRCGLLARFRAEDARRGGILPHEQTRRGPREDRYRLLLATGANFSPIFMMFEDSGAFGAELAVVIAGAPALSYTDDAGVRHRLWWVVDRDRLKRLAETLGGAPTYIADGHHRYATALRHRDERGADAAWTFGYFTPLHAAGLVALPYHRVLSRSPTLAAARKALQGWFLLSDAASLAEAAAAAARSTLPYAFALAEAGGAALVAEALPEAQQLVPVGTPACLAVLDAFFVHHVVLPRLLSVPEAALCFVHSLAEAEQALAEERDRLALLMRPTPVRQVVEVADQGESMPPKSTFFHPKLPSGLVIHPLPASAPLA